MLIWGHEGNNEKHVFLQHVLVRDTKVISLFCIGLLLPTVVIWFISFLASSCMCVLAL